MTIMLIGFASVTLIALSHSGNVSSTCRSEWNFVNSADPSGIPSTALPTEKKERLTALQPGDLARASDKGSSIISESEVAAPRAQALDLMFARLLFDL